MGRTLYLGSLKSDVYFCIYEKDYEQYVKLGTPLEEADIINRFEIRLRNERAYYQSVYCSRLEIPGQSRQPVPVYIHSVLLRRLHFHFPSGYFHK